MRALRKQVEKGMAGIVPHTNLLGYTAALAAYTQCDDWLADLREQFTANREMVTTFVKENLPGVAGHGSRGHLFVLARLYVPGDPRRALKARADFFKKRQKWP